MIMRKAFTRAVVTQAPLNAIRYQHSYATWKIHKVDTTNTNNNNTVLLVTMNSNAVNAMNPQFFTDLHDTLDHIEQSYKSTLPIVLFSNEPHSRVFSAGLDLNYLQTIFNDEAKVTKFVNDINVAFQRVDTFPCPTVAIVNGHNIAGGMVLNFCCDFRVMPLNDEYKTILREVALGISLPYAVSHIIERELKPNALLYKGALLGENLTPRELLKSNLLSDYVEYTGSEDVATLHSQMVKRAVELTSRIDMNVSSTAFRELKRNFKGSSKHSAAEKQIIDDKFVQMLMQRETRDKIVQILNSTKRK